MADGLTVTFNDTVTPTLLAAPDAIRVGVQKVVDQTAAKLFKRVRLATPRDSGAAARGWVEIVEGRGEKATVRLVNKVDYINVLEFGGYPVVSLKKRSAKKKTKKKRPRRKSAKELDRARKSKGTPKRKQGGSQKASHTPVGAVVRGGARLGGGYPPGPRTQKDGGGDPPMLSNVSRQAPKGMVRKQLAAIRPEFLFDLEEAIDKILNGGE